MFQLLSRLNITAFFVIVVFNPGEEIYPAKSTKK
jgi:hypothetical protein